MTNSEPVPQTKRKTRKSTYITTAIVNLILVYVLNNLLNWNIPFLTADFAGVLWAFNLSLGATIVANILYLFYDAGWFRHLGQMVLNIFAFIATYVLYSVFPFTFTSGFWHQAVTIALIVAMVATGIAFIVEFFRLILRKD